MQLQIEILAVTSTTKPTAKGSYVMLDVAYKNINTGKVEGKKVMSFTNKGVFDALKNACQGQTYTVESVKNEQSGYWDWTAVTNGQGGGTVAEPSKASTGYTSPKSTYETPEERAKKQVYIVRQSSLSNAIEILKTGKKELTYDNVVALADDLTDWIFQKEVKSMDINDMEDDIPL